MLPAIGWDRITSEANLAGNRLDCSEIWTVEIEYEHTRNSILANVFKSMCRLRSDREGLLRTWMGNSMRMRRVHDWPWLWHIRPQFDVDLLSLKYMQFELGAALRHLQPAFVWNSQITCIRFIGKRKWCKHLHRQWVLSVNIMKHIHYADAQLNHSMRYIYMAPLNGCPKNPYQFDRILYFKIYAKKKL